MENSREIKVKGIGKYTVSPDYITIHFKLNKTNKDYQKGYEQFQNDIQELQNLISSCGFQEKDLKIENLYSYEKHENIHEKKVFVGYYFCCTCTLGFDIDLTKMGIIIDSLGNSNIQPEINIHFTVKDEEEVKQTLLENATQMARKKAEVLCNTLNAKLGKIKLINYNWTELDMESDTEYEMMVTKGRMLGRKDSYINFTPEDIILEDYAYFVWEIE